MSPDNSITHAAVAVLIRPNGHVLLGQRPQGKPWAGWWEFPGGKIEVNETPLQGLQREMLEELGTEALEAYPWLTRTFAYPEKTVKLHFFLVRAWKQEPHGKEGQLLTWQNPHGLTVEPMLPANIPVVKALTLPSVYGLSNLVEMGESKFFDALQSALAGGLRLIQVREKHLSADALRAFAIEVMARCRPYGAKVLLNTHYELAASLQADGVHLTSVQLMAMKSRPPLEWVAASCHNQRELERAAALGIDFVTLSPVQPTKSHPETAALGWQAFMEMTDDCPLPVFALGGMRRSDIQQAWCHGAHGVAMQRDIWTL